MKTSEAIKIFGSVRGIAMALGISVQAVYRWGDTVPPLRAYQIRDILSARLKENLPCSTIKYTN
jgi:hypothetical protein